MKGTIIAGLFYVCCAVSGYFTGFGISRVTSEQETEQKIVTEDNAPDSEYEAGVFFDGEDRKDITPTVNEFPTPSIILVPTEPPKQVKVEEFATPEASVLQVTVTPTVAPTPGEESVQEERLPSLGALIGSREPVEPLLMEIKVEPQKERVENITLQTVTIPAKIFGQTPVLNPSDAYVSYFEFCYDLIARMEPKVQEKGMNMNVLLTKFALKALLCGVDVEKVDINAPIPRRQAALCLFLAAQVLNEKGTDTSPKSAEKYVTDISDCSSPERKAIAYLYEQGIIKGYQVAGQKFYPSEGLKTKDGSEWLAGTVRCWK